MRKIEVKIRYVLWALRRINKVHLGDVVDYNGEKCCLIQGVNNPYWNLLPLNDENMNKSKRDVYKRIHVSDFKPINSIKDKFNRFKSDYRFQKHNWFSIDVYKPIGNRISYLGSGNIKF